MRRIPGLDPLMKAAAERDQSYRFRGKVPPSTALHVPVAYAAPGKVRDGVAKLRLYDVIDSWGGPWGTSAAEFVDALDALEDGVTEIRLHINSPGGEVWEGLAIMNALRAYDAKVVAYVDGIAASAASFIAASADEVVMGANTQMMIHDALGIMIGQQKDMLEMADFLGGLSDNIASIYAAKAGGATSSWRERMLAETWYSPEEAVAAGLADRVAGEAAEGDAPSDRFDLSAVGARYTGRAEAPPPPVASAPPVPVFDADRQRHRARELAELNRRKP